MTIHPISNQAWQKILRNDPCAYCGRRGRSNSRRPTVDHIKPFSLGGADTWTNYTSACSQCNTHKDTGHINWTPLGLWWAKQHKPQHAAWPKYIKPLLAKKAWLLQKELNG